MFLVFNKEKIYAYVVSILTVCLLFFTANAMNKTDENTQMTSSATEKLLPIYNVQTEEKKVAFTMNCAWNADDIDSILKTLDDNNVKITFFMVGDWVDKYPKEVEEIAKRGHEIRKP
ncbi:MAG: polysaccharide deacetylase family protein [Clostridia bacterium]|jgi:peptidoglycan/xylan/chitin deacetylase (PgdA/CDA1 family)